MTRTTLQTEEMERIADRKVKGSQSMRNYDKWKAEQLKEQKGNLYFEYWFEAFNGFIFEAFKAGEKSSKRNQCVKKVVK